jgi:hypothetical protein
MKIAITNRELAPIPRNIAPGGCRRDYGAVRNCFTCNADAPFSTGRLRRPSLSVAIIECDPDRAWTNDVLFDRTARIVAGIRDAVPVGSVVDEHRCLDSLDICADAAIEDVEVTL